MSTPLLLIALAVVLLMMVILLVNTFASQRISKPAPEAEKQKKFSLAANLAAHDDGLRDLIRDGRTKDAIELYRQFAGVDEYSARDVIEMLAAEIDESAEQQNG